MNKSTKGKLLTGAVVVASVAAAGVALSHKSTRQKLVKGVKIAIDEVQKQAEVMSKQAKDQYEKTEKEIKTTTSEELPTKIPPKMTN